jgi:drug/metabolite transporter (DMT)-like permease
MNRIWINLLLVFTVSLAWGFGGPASFFVTRSLTSSQATFGRCGIAFLGLLPFLFRYGLDLFRHLSRKGRILLASSGLTLGIHFYFFVSGVAYASLSTAVMLVAVEPVLILTVGALVFREKITLESLVAILFSICGIGVISILPHLSTLSGAPAQGRGFGDFSAVAAILTYALYYALNRSLKAEEQALSKVVAGPLTRGFGLASILYSFAAGITGFITLLVHSSEPVPEHAPGTATWIGWIALGFIPTIVGHTLSQIASRRAHPIWISLMSPGETLMSLFIGVLFLNQRMTPHELAGGALIAIGVAIAIHGESKSA